MRNKKIKYCASAQINPKTGKAYKNRYIEVSWDTYRAKTLSLDPKGSFYASRLKSLTEAGYELTFKGERHTLTLKK